VIITQLQKDAEMNATQYELDSASEGFWVIVGYHVPTGRRLAWISNAPDFDAAMDVAELMAAEIDPFGGPWLYGSEWVDFNATIDKYNVDFEEVELDQPIPYSLSRDLSAV
jgi:hypothetical protein